MSTLKRHPVRKLTLRLAALWLSAIIGWWGLLQLWASQCEGAEHLPASMGLAAVSGCGLTAFGLVILLLAILAGAGVAARMISHHRLYRDWTRRQWGHD
ncbi:hypothetical protein [Cupriavidus sp. D39]|uniref:hypothetical protein n=1 Tax=Cupriavidus sp. D39 TaxID=2997877 RepID=UPI00226F843F|nr:hypothetical protein [Cupriavidus sp. D39]MCY0853088.1 hypothetical protein [Cupriavidus sp. D39]